MRRTSGHDAGFTILELTVVIALLAFMGVMIAGSLRSGAVVWSAAQSYSNQLEETEAVRNFLRRLLESVYPKEWPTENGQWELAFSGTSNTLDFLSPAPAVTGKVGFLRVGLKVQEEDNSKALRLVWSPETSDAGANHEVTILNHLAIVEFAYFGAYDDAAEKVWRPDWSHQKTLPRLIAIRAKSANKNASFIDLVVSPRVEASAACEFDFRSDGCRFE